MSTRLNTAFYMEMQNEETLGGRLAKLPFGIMMMILLTGALSYYFEHKQPPQLDATKTTEVAIQRTIAEHQSGKPAAPVQVPVSKDRWYLLGSMAVLVPGAAGLVTLTVIRRRRNFNRQRRGRV